MKRGKLNELALFAGAGGGILGGLLCGFRTICAVEIEEYPRAVLLQRQNDRILDPFPVWDDVCTFDGKPWRGHVDIITGGFPCQAWSRAAHGRNTARNMWPEMLRIIGEVCPVFVLAENVDEGAIAAAQADLADCGFKTCRIKISAADVGADHIRDRWWMVGDSDNKSKLGREVNAEVAMLQASGESIWETFSGNPRVDHGVAARVDRLAAIGNGQVPRVVALAWEILGKNN